MKVLNAPDLKMTLFLLQRMKATIPITTINKKRGVRTAMIHKLLGGVFTTATITHRGKNITLIDYQFKSGTISNNKHPSEIREKN